jgi:hypothetical protein
MKKSKLKTKPAAKRTSEHVASSAGYWLEHSKILEKAGAKTIAVPIDTFQEITASALGQREK